MTDPQEGDDLILAFEAVAKKISLYYKTVGEEGKCGFADNRALSQEISIPRVPPKARDGLAVLVQGVGISLERSDNGDGSGEQFHFPQEGLTPEKLKDLGAALDTKIGPKMLTQKLSQDFGRLIERKTPKETLELLSAFIDSIKVSAAFPERTKGEFQQKILRMLSVQQPSAV